MRQRNIAIIGLILTALSLAALVIIEMRFAEAVASNTSVGLTGLSNELSRHRDASLILLLFSFAALAVAAVFFITARQNKPQTNTSCINSENFEQLSLTYRELLVRYQSLMEINPSAIIEVDLNGNISSLNDPARKLTGRPKDGRTLESPLAQFLPADSNAKLDELFDDIRQGNTVKHRQLPFVWDNGGVSRLDVSGAPVWSDGAVKGFLISIHDTVKAQRLEMELEDARQIAKETTEQLRTTMLDIEEFALLAVKREVKMQEIREKLKKFKEGHGEEILH